MYISKGSKYYFPTFFKEINRYNFLGLYIMYNLVIFNVISFNRSITHLHYFENIRFFNILYSLFLPFSLLLWVVEIIF